MREIYSAHYTIERAQERLENAYAWGDLLPGERPQIERRTGRQMRAAGYGMAAGHSHAYVITAEAGQ